MYAVLIICNFCSCNIHCNLFESHNKSELLHQGTNAQLAYNIRYDLSDKDSDFVSINSKTGCLSTRLSILDRELRHVKVSLFVN